MYRFRAIGSRETVNSVHRVYFHAPLILGNYRCQCFSGVYSAKKERFHKLILVLTTNSLFAKVAIAIKYIIIHLYILWYKRCFQQVQIFKVAIWHLASSLEDPISGNENEDLNENSN